MPLKRKRGGQKGNLNALKHGIYSEQLCPPETEHLQDNTKPANLEAEIEMQRVILRRIMDLIAVSSSVADLARLSAAQATVVNCLNRLVRTQSILGKPPSQDDVTLLQLLKEVHLEHQAEALKAQVNYEPPLSTHHPRPRPRRTTAPMPFRRSPYPHKK
ncbi:MAG: hypothetical protein P8X95_10385 [Anaerolineales bacterium]|jgi:uncharacterized protein YjcR